MDALWWRVPKQALEERTPLRSPDISIGFYPSICPSCQLPDGASRWDKPDNAAGHYFSSSRAPVTLSTILQSAGPIARAVTIPDGNSVRSASEINSWASPSASQCSRNSKRASSEDAFSATFVCPSPSQRLRSSFRAAKAAATLA